MEEAEEKHRVGHFLLDGVKGITLGISAAVPGLSAGTIAVAERCYETLIGAIAGLRKAFKKNFLILLPYLLGLIVGAIGALIGIQKGYEVAPFSITGLFGGFVMGSLPVTFGELRHGQNGKELTKHILSFLICLIVAAGLGIVTALFHMDFSSYLQARVFWIYPLALVAGFIAAAACIVPGISGSMSLMVIGMYIPILNTYATKSGDLSIWNKEGTSYSGSFVLTGIVILLLLAIGAVIGLVVSSKAMKKLLAEHRVPTFYGILGLILGSLVSMFINSNIYPRYTGSNGTKLIQGWDYLVGAILFVVGAVAVFFLIRYSDRKQKESENQNNK